MYEYKLVGYSTGVDNRSDKSNEWKTKKNLKTFDGKSTNNNVMKHYRD